MQHTYWSSSSFLPNIIEICLRVSKLWPAQDFLSLIHATHLLVLLFLPNIIKLSQTVWELWPAQDFGFGGDNYIRKTVKVVSLACDTPTYPPLHYQNMSKGIKVMECTRMSTISASGEIPNKVRVVSLA